MIAPDLQRHADRLYDDLARDSYAGWLDALGRDRLRDLCEQSIELVIEHGDLPTDAAALDESYREGQIDGYDDGYAAGVADAKEAAREAAEAAKSKPA